MNLLKTIYSFPVRLAISALGLAWWWHRFNFIAHWPIIKEFLLNPWFIGLVLGLGLLTAAGKALRYRIILQGPPPTVSILETSSLAEFFLAGFLFCPFKSREATGALLIQGGTKPAQALKAIDLTRLAGAASLGTFFLAGVLSGGLGSIWFIVLAPLFPLAAIAPTARPIPRLSPSSFGLAFLFQAPLILVPALLAGGTRLNLMAPVLVIIPLALAASRLPSWGGLGIREVLLLEFMGGGLLGDSVSLFALASWMILVPVGGLSYVICGYLNKAQSEIKPGIPAR